MQNQYSRVKRTCIWNLLKKDRAEKHPVQFHQFAHFIIPNASAANDSKRFQWEYITFKQKHTFNIACLRLIWNSLFIIINVDLSSIPALLHPFHVEFIKWYMKLLLHVCASHTDGQRSSSLCENKFNMKGASWFAFKFKVEWHSKTNARKKNVETKCFAEVFESEIGANCTFSKLQALKSHRQIILDKL